MRAIPLLLLILTAACGRPLTEGETRFAGELMGPGFDAAKVRIQSAPLLGAIPMTRQARPALTCRERIWPPEEGTIPASVGGMVLFQRLLTARPLDTQDFLAGYPEAQNLNAAMFFAHEMTHVWQWQNRHLTGYHPLRAAGEHTPGTDPYLFELAPGLPFLAYGYEQQASLVEEFVCCRALDPEAERTEALHALLTPVFPGIARRAAVPPSQVRVAWTEAPREGICRP